MPTSTLLIHLLAGFGLSAGSGLNAWIPTLGVSAAGRLDYLELAPNMRWMSSNPALIVFAVLLVADFVGDKVPAVDHVVHAIGLAVHPVVGGAVMAAQTNLLGNVHPALAWVAGGAIGGGVHLGRAALRPIVSAVSFGVGNWLVSLLEDMSSVVLTVLAVIVPILGFIAAIGLMIAIAAGWSRRSRRRRDNTARGAGHADAATGTPAPPGAR